MKTEHRTISDFFFQKKNRHKYHFPAKILIWLSHVSKCSFLFHFHIFLHFSIIILHYNIEKLWIFLNLMAVPAYSRTLHLTDVSMEEEGRSCSWCDLQACQSCLQTQFHHPINFPIGLDDTYPSSGNYARFFRIASTLGAAQHIAH